MVEDLARKIDAIQQGTHPRESARNSNDPKQASTDIGVPARLEIEDLNGKVKRLTENVTKNTHDISTLNSLIPRVDARENQIQPWRYRLPDLTVDDSNDEAIVTAVEVHDSCKVLLGDTLKNSDK